MMVFEMKNWGAQALQCWLNPQWVRGMWNNEGSTLCSMALPPPWAGARASHHRQVRSATGCCKHPLELSLFILHYFCAASEWKVTLNPCPRVYSQRAKRGEKTCCCSSAWSSRILQILNAAFETASPEARESQSFAFLGGLNSATDLAKGQFSEPLHKSNATETMPHTRGSERQTQTLLEKICNFHVCSKMKLRFSSLPHCFWGMESIKIKLRFSYLIH